MKIHVCITPAHKILLDSVFLPSLPAGWNPVIHQIELTGPGDYLSEEFLQCIRRKTQLIVESLEDRSGDLVVWSDVDVCFYARDGNRLGLELGHMLESQACHILFQRECGHLPDVNAGFFVARPCAETASFFSRVIGLMDQNQGWNEQRAINWLLFENQESAPIKWAYLPLTYYARTHGWPPPRDTVLYHANYTVGPDGLGQKLRQFRLAEAYLRGNAMMRQWVNLRMLKALGWGRLWRAAFKRIRSGQGPA